MSGSRSQSSQSTAKKTAKTSQKTAKKLSVPDEPDQLLLPLEDEVSVAKLPAKPKQDDFLAAVGKKLKETKEESGAEIASKQQKKESSKPKQSAPSKPVKPETGIRSIKPSGKKPTQKKNVKRRKKKYSQLPTVIILVCVCIVVALGFWVIRTVLLKNAAPVVPSSVEQEQSYHDEYVMIEIVAGMSAGDACRLLESEGVIASAQELVSYLIEHGLTALVHQGSYLMQRGIDVAQAAERITRAGDEIVSFTVFNGYTIADIDRALVNRKLAQPGEFTASAHYLAETNYLPFAEGWFLPGEYRIMRGRSAEDLAEQMYTALIILLSSYFDAIETSGRTIADILIVASMIQRETNAVEQMPMIADIIYKRLNSGMALGIDATTRYELDDWTNPLTPDVLNEQTPYNTRRKVGLPPSGIGSPGADAIRAAIYPQANSWYYYLHDAQGEIHYGETYDDHLKNIEVYRSVNE